MLTLLFVHTQATLLLIYGHVAALAGFELRTLWGIHVARFESCCWLVHIIFTSYLNRINILKDVKVISEQTG